MNKWTVELLKEFEEDIANSFNKGEIRSPVHLSDGNEEALIQISSLVMTIQFPS